MAQYKKKTSTHKKSGSSARSYHKSSGGRKFVSHKRKLTPEQIEKMQEGRKLAAEKKRNEEITKNRLDALSDLNHTIEKNGKFASKADEFAFAKRNRYLERHRSGNGRK